MKTIYAVLIATLVLLVTFLGACGSEDKDVLGSHKVTKLEFEEKEIRVGQQMRVEVFFETKTSLVGAPDSVELVLFLSRALEFVAGSSSIFDNTTSDKDGREPDEIMVCENGESFLIYRLDNDELEDRTLLEGGYGIRFDVRGASETELAKIDGAAASSQFFSCDASFPGEKSDEVRVLNS
ncbi:hypothetical protein OAO01_00080 [Oligoflexia bacterium]|nr:hypothetical protein [Oligoflexia bacterium]